MAVSRTTQKQEAWKCSAISTLRIRVNRADTGAQHPSSAPMAELLTAKELEAMLKIDVKTIYSYVQRGLIPYVRIQSNVRFVRQQILDWIGEHNFRPRQANGNGAKRRMQ